MQIDKFTELLKQFEGDGPEEDVPPFWVKDIQAAQIAAIYYYLFEDNSVVPEISHRGLRETVEYLFDMVTRSGYDTLEKLLHYYARQWAIYSNRFRDAKRRLDDEEKNKKN